MSDEGAATAEEAIKSERCSIPRELYNKVEIIASRNKKTNCEVQNDASASIE